MMRTLVVLMMAGVALGNTLTRRATGESPVSESVESATQKATDYPIFGTGNQETVVSTGSQPLFNPYPTYPDYKPSARPTQQSVAVAAEPEAAPTTWVSLVTAKLIPLGNYALTYGKQGLKYILQLMVVLVIGVLFTTSLCTFSPLCSISFEGMGFKNQVKEQVAQLAKTYVTPENVNAASVVVGRALESFAEVQRQSKIRKAMEDQTMTLTGGRRSRR